METTIEVRVMRVENGLHLAEWRDDNGMLERYWIPGEMILSLEGNQAVAINPKRGIPFGDNLLENFQLQLSYRDLDRELRNRRIWKYADVLANPNGVVQALQAALGVDLAAFIDAANQQTRR